MFSLLIQWLKCLEQEGVEVEAAIRQKLQGGVLVAEVMAGEVPMKEVSETTVDRGEMVSTGQLLAKIEVHLANNFLYRIGQSS